MRIHTMNFSEQLEQALKERIKGEVRFDHTSRLLYSTDASNYQIMPIGVIIPHDANDVITAIKIAAEENIPITPRGAGTSLAGQTVGKSLIIDFSKYINRVIEINHEEKTARIEPGVVLMQLNTALKPHKLALGPDPATQNRCNIGGMIANNSSGSHSLVYGKTSDHVIALKCVLSDGTVVNFGPQENADGGRAASMAAEVKQLLEPYREEILARYPNIPRRVSGYSFDTLLKSPSSSMADLIVGSEGTLAVILEAEMSLVSIPSRKGMALLSFSDRFHALDSVPILLQTDTQVLEMIDYRLLEMARSSPEHKDKMGIFGLDTKGVLILEFGNDDEDVIRQNLENLQKLSSSLPGNPECSVIMDNATQESVWQLRESALGLLSRRVGPVKSVEFVEDTAIPPDRLGEYVRRIEEIVAKHDTASAIYGHAGQGCLHMRFDLNLRTTEGVAKMRDIAEEVTDLVIEFGGVCSGEHGDGISRSEFLPKLYGKTIMNLHREVKKIFDPAGIMNPGKIVDPLKMDQNLRFGPNYKSKEPKTYFDFTEEQGYAMAVEACNGDAACLKMDTGTMCPSYMVTRDEMHSTRARANALREALKGNFDGLGDKRIIEVLDLCIECKGCKLECPVGVDMTKYKAEFLTHYYDIHGIPARVKAFGYIDRLAAIGSSIPWLANWLGQGPFSGILKRFSGIHPARNLPKLAPESFSSWFEKSGYGRSEDGPNVVLLDDAFNNYFSPDTLKTAVKVLDRAGFGVMLPPAPVSCGRAFISKGMLKHARSTIEHLVDVLAPLVEEGYKIVGIEPSEVLTLRDELKSLVTDPRAKNISDSAFTFEEFLSQFAVDFKPGRLEGHVLVHAHCHQKAICGMDAIEDILNRIEGLTYTILDSGCCGMAGSFGYEKEHYEISRLIGERVLLPAVRALPAEDFVIADGFSCRTQIADFCDGRQALHMAELLAMTL